MNDETVEHRMHTSIPVT